MVKAPSLISLAALAVKRELLLGDDVIPYVYELPADLFDILLTCLPPLALQKLQTKMPFRDGDDCGSPDYCFENGRKRGRYGNFNTVWKKLFKTRWSGFTDQIEPVDWQQRYWEAHVQGCLDEAAELVVLPSFRGLISDINISDTILNYIGYEQQMNHLACDYSKLSYHCQQFGHYARCLRLQNALCVEETCFFLVSAIIEGEQVAKLGTTVDQIRRTLKRWHHLNFFTASSLQVLSREFVVLFAVRESEYTRLKTYQSTYQALSKTAQVL